MLNIELHVVGIVSSSNENPEQDVLRVRLNINGNYGGELQCTRMNLTLLSGKLFGNNYKIVEKTNE